jgi:N-acetylglucosamine kinase-like BadF-type ATPase
VTYFVGVEGFCTSYSVAVLSDENGHIESALRFDETLNLHTIEPRRLGNLLQSLLRLLFDRANRNVHDEMQTARVCIGMSGVTFTYDRVVGLPKLMEEVLQWTFGANGERLACTGDAEITFASHAQGDSGSLVLSHTGSVAYAVGRNAGDELKHYRYGGWGPQLGDEGSGYWIGREALRAICLEHAAYAPASTLWRCINEWLTKPWIAGRAWQWGSQHWRDILESFDEERGRHPDMDLRTLVYRFAHRLAFDAERDRRRQTISGLLIPVMRARREHDPTATRIVDEALAHLDKQHEAVCQIAQTRAGIDSFGPVVLYGGVLNHNEELRTNLEQRIKQRLGGGRVLTRFSEGTMRPALGALLFALGGSTSNALQLPGRDVIERVKREANDPRWAKALAND